MHCITCKKECPVSPCANCFLVGIERRIKHHTRKEHLIEKGDILIVTDALSEHVLTSMNLPPVTIQYADAKGSVNQESESSHKKQRSHVKYVLPITLDESIYSFLSTYFHNPLPHEKESTEHSTNDERSGKKENHGAHVISLFSALTREELERYASLKKLPFPKKISSPFAAHLLAFSRRYPQTFYALNQSIASYEQMRRFK